MTTRALLLALFPALAFADWPPPGVRPHHVVTPADDFVNNLWDSSHNYRLYMYQDTFKITMNTFVEDLKRLDIAYVNSNITCSLRLNCHDLSHETAGPNRDVGWATYFLPCLGDPIQVHHGEFCQMKDNRGWQFDNLWIRFQDQFFNVASSDCKEEVYHEYRHYPLNCRHEKIREQNRWFVKHYRRTCEVGTHLTEENIKAVMDNLPPKRGMPQGRDYCEGGD